MTSMTKISPQGLVFLFSRNMQSLLWKEVMTYDINYNINDIIDDSSYSCSIYPRIGYYCIYNYIRRYNRWFGYAKNIIKEIAVPNKLVTRIFIPLTSNNWLPTPPNELIRFKGRIKQDASSI